jgi:hypothetical protein
LRRPWLRRLGATSCWARWALGSHELVGHGGPWRVWDTRALALEPRGLLQACAPCIEARSPRRSGRRFQVATKRVGLIHSARKPRLGRSYHGPAHLPSARPFLLNFCPPSPRLLGVPRACGGGKYFGWPPAPHMRAKLDARQQAGTRVRSAEASSPRRLEAPRPPRCVPGPAPQYR